MTPLAESAAIILGASEWRGPDGFEAHPAFRNSAEFVRDYLTASGLPDGNLLWLFDDAREPFAITNAMVEFLGARSGPAVRNILFYYVGHGGSWQRDYYLALRCTRRSEMELSALAVRHVARKLLEEASDKRQIIILDACYAGAAVAHFVVQSAAEAPAEPPHRQIREILPRTDIVHGTSVFCAAGMRQALAPVGAEYTMFSGALRRVLAAGDAKCHRPFLTLEHVAKLVEKDILDTFDNKSVRPELHTPRQEKGDIRGLSLFPNPAWRAPRETPEFRALRAEHEALRCELRPLAHELEWERESRRAGRYDAITQRKEIDQFGNVALRHQIGGITGPAEGTIRSLPYNFWAAPELGTCIVDDIRDEQRNRSEERGKLPAPATSVNGTLVLNPPAGAATAHDGFTVRVRLINAFAVTRLDAQLRNQPETEETTIRSLFPARHVQLIVVFPPGYAPPESPHIAALVADERPVQEWAEDTDETSRVAPGLHFDAERGCAILHLERTLPRFKYVMKWHLPAPPASQFEEAPRAREEVRSLVALGSRERARLGARLASIRDEACRQPLGWREDQPRNVHLALLAFDEERGVTEVVAATDGPARTLGLPWGAGVVGWVMRRRRPVFVDTREHGASGIYRVLPGLPMERFVLCVPLPLPSDAARRSELLLDPAIPCAVASLSCVDESGNMARLIGPKPAGSACSGTLMGAVATGLAAGILDLLAGMSA